MQVQIMKTSSDEKALFKNLETVYTSEVKLKDSVSIMNPVLYLQKNYPISDINYLFIPDWNRYYFIVDIIAMNGNTYEIHCKEDVLQSFQSDINNLEGVVERQEFFYDLELDDSNIFASKERKIQRYMIGALGSNYNIYLTATN